MVTQFKDDMVTSPISTSVSFHSFLPVSLSLLLLSIQIHEYLFSSSCFVGDETYLREIGCYLHVEHVIEDLNTL